MNFFFFLYHFQRVVQLPRRVSPVTANVRHYRCNFKLEPQKSNTLNQNRTCSSPDSISRFTARARQPPIQLQRTIAGFSEFDPRFDARNPEAAAVDSFSDIVSSKRLRNSFNGKFS